MAGEEWARRVVEKELKRSVFINDENIRRAWTGIWMAKYGFIKEMDQRAAQWRTSRGCH